MTRYGDWSQKARQLTEETDRNGATYYKQVQEMIMKHYMEPQNSSKVDWNEDGLQDLHNQLNEIREAIVLLYYVSANTASKEQIATLYKRIMSLYRYSLDVDNH